MKSHKNFPQGLPSPDEVKIPPELAVACYQAGRDIFDVFILWLELRCLDQALMGRDGKKGYRCGQLPYLAAEFWLQNRGRNITKVETLIRRTDIFFGEVYRWPKPPLLRLRSFERLCKYFHVRPVSPWRWVPLSRFTNGKRHSAVRAVMTLPPEDAPSWVRDKPHPRATRRANTGVPERTQFEDEKRLAIGEGRRNWQPNDDDRGKYPLHQIGNSHLGFGFSGPMGRIFSVQVAILGTRRVKMGAREVQRLLGRPWSKRYFPTQKSLLSTLRRQDSHEGKGVPSGLASIIIPQQVDADPLYQVSRADRMRPKAREWRCVSV